LSTSWSRSSVATDLGSKTARCAVIVGGRIGSHKGVNLPGVPLPIPSLTEKDTVDLEFALGIGVDFVALSFVRSGSDVRALRTLIEAAGSAAHVIAKIEKSEAVLALDEILTESQAVMVARGDLGVEIPPEDVPGRQKELIRACRQAAKPVIVATQMLDSMVSMTRPTRAEASAVEHRGQILFTRQVIGLLTEHAPIGRDPDNRTLRSHDGVMHRPGACMDIQDLPALTLCCVMTIRP